MRVIMNISKEQIEQFDRRAGKIIDIVTPAALIFVGVFVTALIFIVGAFMVLPEPVDRDVKQWCDEYQQTWTYEQCESIVGY